MTNSERDEGFGCDDCRYYSNRRCRLWEIRIPESHDSYCVSGQLDLGKTPKMEENKQ